MIIEIRTKKADKYYIDLETLRHFYVQIQNTNFVILRCSENIGSKEYYIDCKSIYSFSEFTPIKRHTYDN